MNEPLDGEGIELENNIITSTAGPLRLAALMALLLSTAVLVVVSLIIGIGSRP